MQVEVDGRGVAAVAPEPDVPALDLGVVLDGLDVGLACDVAFEVFGDELVRGLFARVEVRDLGHVHWTRARAVRSEYSRRSRAAAMLHVYRPARSAAWAPIVAATSGNVRRRSTGSA